MDYQQFKKYLKKVVLYQSRNKKHSHWSLRRKCEANFTTRQLAELTGLGNATVWRYLKRMAKEKILVCPRYLKTKERHFNSMVFYIHQEVYDILKAISKKRFYKFIAKQYKKNSESFETLKEFLKKNSLGIYTLCMIPTLEQRDFCLRSRSGDVIFGDEMDLRRKNSKKSFASDSKVSSTLSGLIDLL